MLRKIIPFFFLLMASTVWAQTTVTITSNKTHITEDESLNIIATLNAPSSSDVTVNFVFSGTATAEEDYTTMAGPYTVAGVTSNPGLTADKLNLPIGICLDASGNIYIADQANHRIQKWEPGATSGSTVAGESGVSGSDDAHLNNPSDVFVDASGTIYIADQDNHRIQKWLSGASSGTTVAGVSGVAGSTMDKLDEPHGVFVDASGNIYISDYNNHRVQEWVSGVGIGATVAGVSGVAGSDDTHLNHPFGIFVDASNNLFIADALNHRIQEWASGSFVATVAGVSGVAGSTSEKLDTPVDVFVDAFGSVYVADASNNRVQKWESGATAGVTVAGGNGLGTSMDQFHYPTGVWVDNYGKIYVVDNSNHRVQQNQYSPSIVIEAGQTSNILQLDGIVDAVNEGDETIIVDATAINASLVEPSQLNLTILCADAPVGDPTQSFCNSAQVSDLTATGTDIKWYETSTGGSALLATDALVDGTSYFATQTIDGCESSLRFEVAVTINAPAAPTGDATQSFIDQATVADLEATGSNIQWYAASSGGSALATSISLVDGTSYFASQTISGCESASRFEVVVTIIPYTTNTWDGSEGDGDWTNPDNWSSGVVPDASHNVVIPDGEFPEYSGSGSCHNLTIAAGGGLTLSGTITAGGQVIIESDASSSGSLIFTGSGEIVTNAKSTLATPASITFKRYLTDSEWHLMGSPLNGQTINSSFLSSNSISGMKDYEEGSDNWSTDYLTTAPDAPFSLGKGYATKRSGADVVSLTGTPNSAQVDIALTRGDNGWNLLSNPFTSAIAANNSADGTNNLLTINAGSLDGSFTGLYIWDEASSSYVIINHSGGTLNQDYLQAGQGFFVRSSDPASGTFSMTPAMQSHQTNVDFKSSKEESWASIVLNLESNDNTASTKISYHEKMTRGLDVGYDAGLFGANSNLSIYSRLIEDNGVDFGLQCLPLDYENLIIPLGVRAKDGDMINFWVSSANIPEEYAIILEDRVLDKFIDLTNQNDKYTLQLSSDLNGFGRFYLHTSFKNTLGLGNVEQDKPYMVLTHLNDKQVLVLGDVHSTTSARIYSISGKLVKEVDFEQSNEQHISFNEESGIYIIQILDSEKQFTQKFVWIK